MPEQPTTDKVAHVDTYHDYEVEDPYRWLEDVDGEAVGHWVDLQNDYTRALLDGVEQRQPIRERLEELWTFRRWSTPRRSGTRLFWTENDGTQAQGVLMVGEGSDAESAMASGRLLLDPNTLSEDGTVALSSYEPSPDGLQIACAVSEAGSDWLEWRVLNVDGSEVGERLRYSKFSGATWLKDGTGFFYQRYPKPPEGEEFAAQTKNAQLCFHRVGTDQGEDRVLYERPDEPDWGFASEVSHDGTLCVVSVWQGTDQRNRLGVIDLTEAEWQLKPLLWEFDAQWSFIGLDRSDEEAPRLVLLTDKDAPNGRVVAVDLEHLSSDEGFVLEERIPAGSDRIESVRFLAERLVVTRLHDAAHEVALHSRSGALEGELALPGGFVSVESIQGSRDRDEILLSFESVNRPASLLRVDAASRETSILRTPDLPFDPDSLIVDQVRVGSSDGASLRLLLLHKPGLKLDGRTPTLLYGYGGFDISLTPRFSVERFVLAEMGGLYAQATLRGGGEFGQAWHEAGMRERKQNVFNDFISCAEYLIRNGYTTSSQLAINGRSNGGLLVGAVMVQRPELFAAAIPEVGVLDMLRYDEFTIGWAWEPEYGSAKDPEMFEPLLAYSPYHNVVEGVPYPATLVTTGDHDDRVYPAHSFKFAAALQEASTSGPVMIRITKSAGHGAGKPRGVQIDEAADRLAFLVRSIGLGN